MQSILFFCAAAAFTGVLLSYHTHVMLGIIACAGLNATLMSAVNNIITSMIPLERGSGAGLFAGVMDAFCYVGSTMSGFVPGLIIEKWGFGTLLPILPACALFLAVFTVIVTASETKLKKAGKQ
jgi:predicted MFS family arabinose efflux permease